jgi:hypothetical protein
MAIWVEDVGSSIIFGEFRDVAIAAAMAMSRGSTASRAGLEAGRYARKPQGR